jgi:aerobic-type carbon monoxide dehydrogenase small subunit (CoxS/CutS family)
MTEITINFSLNGKKTSLTSQPNRTLLEVLREDLGLTGAKDACGGEGECGACTVILDGKPVNSCLILIGQVENCFITTIEGLASKDGAYHPIQRAFVEAGAVQCGYCTPGAVLAVKALLDVNSQPSEEEIREGLSGNLCRCTGYNKMIDAVHLVLKGGWDG